MAKLHIIYDPTNNLKTSTLPDKIKIAIMPLSDTIKGNELQNLIIKLAKMLLEQIDDR